jgi:hypothetical protein
MSLPEIMQRDLRSRSREIMDAVELPLFTTSPGDYTGLEKLIRIVPVTRPPLPHENKPGPA